VRIAVRPDGISSQEAEEKRENTLNFNTTARIGLLIIASLMILRNLGEIAPILAAAGIVGLALVWRTHQRDIISGLFIILEYRVEIL
jgi:small conductance mechanosensitive channel